MKDAHEITRPLPVITTDSRLPSRRAGMAYDEELADTLLAAMTESVQARRPWAERTGLALRLLTATPRRSAAFTAWAFLAIVLVVDWLDRPTMSVRTLFGPAKVSCGLDVYVYGYPDRSVSAACRHAEASHFGIFIAVLILLLGGVTVALRLLVHGAAATACPRLGRFVGALYRSPLHAMPVCAGLLAVVAGCFSLRPATAQFESSGVLVDARCGADSYFFGYPGRTVAAACDRAFSGQAHVLIAAAIVAIVGVVALLHFIYSRLAERQARYRLLSTAMALFCGVFALIALRPVRVSVGTAPTPVVANCALDTFVAGYPDQEVQASCRAGYAGRAAVGIPLAAVSVGLIGLALLWQPRNRREMQTSGRAVVR